jgi:hypothetical protein
MHLSEPHHAVGPSCVLAGRAGDARLIAEQVGHAIAAMSHVDHTSYELERLAAERAADARRTVDPV